MMNETLKNPDVLLFLLGLTVGITVIVVRMIRNYIVMSRRESYPKVIVYEDRESYEMRKDGRIKILYPTRLDQREDHHAHKYPHIIYIDEEGKRWSTMFEEFNGTYYRGFHNKIAIKHTPRGEMPTGLSLIGILFIKSFNKWPR